MFKTITEKTEGGEENTEELIDLAKYIYAYDPLIKRRVAHVVVNGWAISLVTGNRFRYSG